jgi:hypothetical protein
VSRKSHQRETTLSVIVEYCSDLGRRPVALRPIRPYQIVIHGPILPNSGPTRLTGLPDGYVLPGVGEDGQVTRKRAEAERLADATRRGAESFPRIGGPGCEVNPCVLEEAQHGGNWARSSPIQPHSAPSGTSTFDPLGAMFSGQSPCVTAPGDQAVRFCQTSTAPNPGGET